MLLGGIGILSAVIAAVICAVSGGFASLAWLWLLPVGFLGSYLGLFLVAFLFFWISSSIIDIEKGSSESPFYRRVAMIYIQAALTILGMRIHTKGLEKVPAQGRFLLVCNHQQMADPGVILACLKKSQMAFISKQENMTMPVIGKFMHKIMCQLMDRENDREALKTILKCIELIKEDKVSIAVFPEGYIKPDRKLHHFRHGVFKIAQKTQVPIVVCTLQNAQYVFKNGLRLKPTHVHLHLVDVIQPEEYAGLSTVELSTRVYEMMARDLGPENVSEEE